MNNQSEQELRIKLADAVKDGISNHTGEWINHFLGGSDDGTYLRAVMSSNRLFKNLEQLITQHTEQKVLEARIYELENTTDHYGNDLMLLCGGRRSMSKHERLAELQAQLKEDK